MGREVRMVSPDWVHPDRTPLFEGHRLADETTEWDKQSKEWAAGVFPDYASEKSRQMSYEEWAGTRPDPDDYMPAWTPEQATHMMMYETCSEGSPISPAFKCPNELAHWLSDNNASIFGGDTATREEWSKIIDGADAFLTVSSAGMEVKIL